MSVVYRCNSMWVALAICAAVLGGHAEAVQKGQSFSTNAICRQNHCINPVFPGMQDLAMLETEAWTCQSLETIKTSMRFCKDAVDYDVALPAANSSSNVLAAVEVQEVRVLTAYRYHLAAMNMDAWEHQDPSQSTDGCVRAVWVMLCNTYFPQSGTNCAAGQSSTYLKPCKNVCENYVEACGVQCCDESVKCVVDEPVSLLGQESGSLVNVGYADEVGPALTCTGAAGRTGIAWPMVTLLILLSLALLPGSGASTGASHHTSTDSRHVGHSQHGLTWGHAAITLVLTLLATSLQGCDVLGHATAAWQSRASYLLTFQTLAVGKVGNSHAVLNSCEIVGIQTDQQCNGNGVCKVWNSTVVDTSVAPLSFCECYRDWADPECRTRRKSQAKAFLLSLYGGFLGLDRFYLGQFYTAFVKLSTLGGLGAWWIFDVAYIGSAPVYAYNYRLAEDLPHWLYVGLSVCTFAALGVLVFNVYGSQVRKRRQMAKLLLQAEDEFFKYRSATVNIDPMDRVGMPTRSTYAVPAPPGGIYGSMAPSPEVAYVSHGNPLAAYSTYASIQGQGSMTS